ncbi:MAG: hypothetical protein GX881_03050, partial [Firmicutes bacterium]|nr:hypothetical protein [Bacillota bacterium]
LIESTFGVDLVDCISDNDKNIVNNFLQEKHGNDLFEFTTPTHLFLDVISGFVDWPELVLINLPVGGYKVHNIIPRDFMDADLFQIYLKIVLALRSHKQSGLLNSYLQARKYAGFDVPMVEIGGGVVIDNIKDNISNCEKAIDNMNNLRELIGEWREV